MNNPNIATIRDCERSLRAINRSPRTLSNYREALDQLTAATGNRDLLELTRADVEDFVIAVRTRISASTAANRYRALRRFYNWAVEDELIDVSPMARMHMPKATECPRSSPRRAPRLPTR